MTRHKIWVGVVAAAGVGTLAWSAWKVVVADLPLSASVAAWALWLIVAAAAVTMVGYAGELARHPHTLRDLASWKPLPGLGLLWIAGLTAAVSFWFVLPSAPASAPTHPAETGASGQHLAPVAPETPTRTATPSSRSQPRTTAPAVSPSVQNVQSLQSVQRIQRVPHTVATPRLPAPRTSAPRPSTSSSTTATSSTTTPIIDLTLPGSSHRTSKPPHPK